MGKINLFMNISLDGYFEAPGHDISWTTSNFDAFSPDADNQVEGLLFGHRTYDMMEAFWPTPQAMEVAPEVAMFMNARRKIVVSHRPFEPQWENVTVICDDVIESVHRLKDQTDKTFLMFGSNTLCVSLMQAGLVDLFQILVNPVAIGQGTPLFAGLRGTAPLALQDSHAYPSGCVLLTYTPAGLGT